MRAGANDLRAILRWGRRLRPEALRPFGIESGHAPPCHATEQKLAGRRIPEDDDQLEQALLDPAGYMVDGLGDFGEDGERVGPPHDTNQVMQALWSWWYWDSTVEVLHDRNDHARTRGNTCPKWIELAWRCP